MTTSGSPTRHLAFSTTILAVRKGDGGWPSPPLPGVTQAANRSGRSAKAPVAPPSQPSSPSIQRRFASSFLSAIEICTAALSPHSPPLPVVTGWGSVARGSGLHRVRHTYWSVFVGGGEGSWKRWRRGKGVPDHQMLHTSGALHIRTCRLWCCLTKLELHARCVPVPFGKGGGDET